MKWKIEACKPGDMVRVKIGFIYHYGVFVSEHEVVQFGHPHRDLSAANPKKDIRVFKSSAAEFAAGGMIERAEMSLLERLKRHSRGKTVALARARIGENGYDILHNNCEHFANWCVFGKNVCSQTDQIASKWRDRPRLDVYLQPVGEEENYTAKVELREREMARVTDTPLRRQKSTAWGLLEYALLRSFGKKMSGVRFSIAKNGKWICDQCFFSISHTEHWAAVAVSNAPVGVDIEEIEAFLNREPQKIARFLVAGKKQAESLTSETILKTWVLKESIYKCVGKGAFVPSRISIGREKTRYVPHVPETNLALAIAGVHVNQSCVYLCKSNQHVCSLEIQEAEAQ